MPRLTYAQQLRHPRWQRRRLEKLEAAGWRCERCGDGETTLHVHHGRYHGMAWDAPAESLTVFCEHCHSAEHGFPAPSTSRSSARSRWERLARYNLRACVILAGRPGEAGDVEDLARALCAEDGLDYAALEAAL